MASRTATMPGCAGQGGSAAQIHQTGNFAQRAVRILAGMRASARRNNSSRRDGGKGVEQRDMGLQPVAFRREMRAAQAISPCQHGLAAVRP